MLWVISYHLSLITDKVNSKANVEEGGIEVKKQMSREQQKMSSR